VFGIGGSEILVILIIALLFLGPDKLPDAAKQISKGIRDLKKHSKILTQTIENDETIGGALRDIKSALRGDEIAPRPPVKKPVVQNKIEGEKVAELAPAEAVETEAKLPTVMTEEETAAHDLQQAELAKPKTITLPQTAGEPNADASDLKGTHDASELAAMIKPPPGETVKREEPLPPEEEPKQKHG
jgi:sec-independent protein translocase protein TatB